MRTMKQRNENPEIRVYPHTRKRLKVLAAQHSMSMIDFVEWLVAQQIEREKGGKDVTQDV
jgi:hypothetical protein